MQTGVLDEVPAGGGGDGGDVADVLHHGGDGDGGHDEDGGDVELGDDELLQADQVRLADGGEVDERLHHAVRVRQLRTAGGGDERDEVAADYAEEDGDDLDHALAPDVGDDDDRHGDEREPPAGRGVVDRGAGEVQTDHDDHGAGDDGREVAHDLLRAEHFEQQREHEVEKTRDHDAAECVGELFIAAHTGVFAGVQLGDGLEAAEVGERGAEERGDLHLGADVEEERAEAGEEQSGLDGKRQAVALHEDGDEHRRAKHGEHVLQAQHQHSGGAQLAGVIDGFVSEFFLHVIFPLSSDFDVCSYLTKRLSAPRGQKKRPVKNYRSKETISLSTKTVLIKIETPAGRNFFLYTYCVMAVSSLVCFFCK